MPVSGDEAGDEQDARGQGGGMPRWFKLFAVLGALIVAGIATIHLMGGGMGDHSMGMHMP